MSAKELNIAMVSSSLKSYSETFIQAQKDRLNGKIFYYYGGVRPTKLEGHGSIIIKSAGIKKKLGLLDYDIISQSFVDSLKKNKIDVVIAQYGPTGEAIATICEDLKIPIIVHFHGYDASVNTVIQKNNSYKDVFRVASKVIVVSKKMYNDILNLGCPEDKLVYNVYGPHPDFERVIPTFSKKQFLAVGRFTDKKAPYYTILAFKSIVEKHADAKLLFAGDGELLNTCKNLVRHFGLIDQVKFLGIISPEEYRVLLSESLAFVQHSIIADSGDSEGTPVAILEASLAGLPIISTLHAGIPDVIIHEQTGLLSKEHDIDGMTKNMLQLLEDLDFTKKLGTQGKVHISEYYSMKMHIATLNDILNQAVLEM